MTDNNAKKERLLELLADQAMFSLEEQERNELEALRQDFPEHSDDLSFERAAAALGVAALGMEEPMPAGLQRKILAGADDFFAARENVAPPAADSAPATETTPPQQQREEMVADIRQVEFERPKPGFMQWLGWGVAAFATIALVANIWMTRVAEPVQVADDRPPVVTPEREPTLAEQKQQLLASAGDVVRTEWSSPDESVSLQGEIVWSDTAQKGFMTFRGLPVNDRTREAYQLWIFEDPNQKYPIDGGVFDVEGSGEVIVPIDAKLRVEDPKMFAVTVEKPGGVVVSEREKIAALAKVAA